jgi:hypothetical protein
MRMENQKEKDMQDTKDKVQDSKVAVSDPTKLPTDVPATDDNKATAPAVASPDAKTEAKQV